MSDEERGVRGKGGGLLQLRSDRRLGHEWDDWDGAPLPDGGDFESGAGLFFAVAGTAGLGWMGVCLVVIWLIAPRLEAFSPWADVVLVWVVVGAFIAWSAWLVAIGVGVRSGRSWIPERLAERGVLAWAMPKVEWVGRRLGVSRDRLGHSMIRVHNRLAVGRGRGAIPAEDLLILLPRCLGKEGMSGAIGVSARYGVPAFVASRGRYAREMIRRRRPRAVVAVACERDLVSGIHDVAGHLPVVGATLRLPDGPCRNTVFAVDELEEQVRRMLGLEVSSE